MLSDASCARCSSELGGELMISWVFQSGRAFLYLAVIWGFYDHLAN